VQMVVNPVEVSEMVARGRHRFCGRKQAGSAMEVRDTRVVAMAVADKREVEAIREAERR